MPVRPHLVADADNAEIADWLAGRVGAALASDGRVAITVPGGSTPFPILECLVAKDVDWARLTVWPGDDRIVPESHPASNVGRIRALFEPVGAQVVALSDKGDPPHFALAWLGMGGDGHIASLFPNTDPSVDDTRRIVRIVPNPLPPEAPFERLSLTIPALLDSDEIVFVIRGDDKRDVFAAAARGGSDLPVARLLSAAHQPVTCFT